MSRKHIFTAVVVGMITASIATTGAIHLQAATSPQVLASSNPPLTQAAPMVTGAFDPNLFVSLSKRTVPAVVNISSMSAPRHRNTQSYGLDSPEDFFRHFYGEMPPQGAAPRAMSLGTGFLIDSNGTILTNHHVVRGADEIKIQFTEDANEKPVAAKVIGSDPGLDIALLKVVTDRKLSGLVLGDSDRLEVGEYVMAVGNPFGQGHSVTHGIISAKGRLSPDLPLAQYLQTDAPINPGNSGGPLLNIKGEVIGINNAIDARAQGIGFAIPINAVKAILTPLMEDGKVSRGYLGIRVEPLAPEMAVKLGVAKDLQGAVVAGVEPGLPAFNVGIRPYDVITEVNGKSIRNAGDLVASVTAVSAGKSVAIKINRAGKTSEYSVKLAQRPTEETVAHR